MTDAETEQFEKDLSAMFKIPCGYQLPEGWQERALARYEAEQRVWWRRAWRAIGLVPFAIGWLVRCAYRRVSRRGRR